jgi:poly-gamma-glutamate synthesis protein (capsule biosynthesis protein)
MVPNIQTNIYAVGDISLAGFKYAEPLFRLFKQVKTVWSNSDLVVGNLESPLLENGNFIINKCVLKANPRWAECIKSEGISLLSLANNHMMDYGPEGLFRTLEVLKEAGLSFVGAGKNKNSALAPHYMELNGKSFAFLARSSVIVSSPCYASKNSPGVAYLDESETKDAIMECKKNADRVVLLIHWGIEHYQHPTPSQRKLAKKLIEAGADIILGHHPHVIQGVEPVDKGLVCYSLGNFIFNDIPWSFSNDEGKQQDRVVKLTEYNRKGGILKVTLSEKGVQSYDFLPTFIRSDGTVIAENTLERKQEFDRLSSRLQWTVYSLFWRSYSMRQEWKLRLKPMLKEKMTWSKLRNLRPKHFRQLLNIVRRSTKITAEKTTNPYE